MGPRLLGVVSKLTPAPPLKGPTQIIEISGAATVCNAGGMTGYDDAGMLEI